MEETGMLGLIRHIRRWKIKYSKCFSKLLVVYFGSVLKDRVVHTTGRNRSYMNMHTCLL